MRQPSFVFASSLAVALGWLGTETSAFAALGKEGTKQAATPTSSASETDSDTGGGSQSNQKDTNIRSLPQGANPDIVANERVEQKAWEIGGGFETHHLVRQDDLGGDAAFKQFNVLGVYGQYDLSQYDRVRVRGFIYEYFLADQGETGFRFDDITLQYIRRIPLPKQFTLRLTGQLTVPTAYESQLSSNITTPHVGINLEKKVGRYIDLTANTGASYFIDKYRENENGGNVNPQASLSFGLSAEVTMPFHEPLSIGADVGTGYTWHYQPNNTSDPNPAVQQNGTVGDAQFDSQPITQSYFGEIYARYVLPTIFGVRSDILVAYSEGDPTYGNVSVLHDGVGHFYGFYRYQSEVYAALSLAY